MKLRKKTLLIVGAALVALNLMLYATSSFVLLRDFDRLEERYVRQDVVHALGAIASEIASTNTMARDYAEWDDTYEFMQTGNREYVRSNLVDSTFSYLNLNVMVFVDREGNIQFSKGFDRRSQTAAPLPEGLTSHLQLESPLLQHEETNDSVSGLLKLRDRVMTVVSRPIVTSSATGPARGTLIVARDLDRPEIQNIGNRTPALRACLPSSTGRAGIFWVVPSLTSISPMQGIGGTPSASASAAVNTAITPGAEAAAPTSMPSIRALA